MTVHFVEPFCFCNAFSAHKFWDPPAKFGSSIPAWSESGWYYASKHIDKTKSALHFKVGRNNNFKASAASLRFSTGYTFKRWPLVNKWSTYHCPASLWWCKSKWSTRCLQFIGWMTWRMPLWVVACKVAFAALRPSPNTQETCPCVMALWQSFKTTASICLSKTFTEDTMWLAKEG